MKFVFACMVLVAVAHARPEQKYTDRYDNVDVPQILSNQRLLVPYLKCVLEQGRCSPDGKELRSHIREALENNCGKCTDKQRESTRLVIGHLINKEPAYWNQLVNKYDPSRKYVNRYETELRTVA
uniref:Putative chemosensory protein 2 n=1 Tax=Conopomorpha sinensis TaxID=940481 RepID=A0A5Q2UT87_9NEOP|nr:putative chemosensory protein 2 [Conopomorpha sinensis]WGJ79143.1 chemosensory protein 4 [Conopomorpha sinensis]